MIISCTQAKKCLQMFPLINTTFFLGNLHQNFSIVKKKEHHMGNLNNTFKRVTILHHFSYA